MYMCARVYCWPHIPEEREDFHPALQADKSLAKEGMTERLPMGDPSVKRHAVLRLCFLETSGLMSADGLSKKALLPHKQPE